MRRIAREIAGRWVATDEMRDKLAREIDAAITSEVEKDFAALEKLRDEHPEVLR